MKKLTLTIAIVIGLTMGAVAQNGGGLFQRGEECAESGGRGSNEPLLPIHGQGGDQDADAPLGGGVALLFGMAVLYLTRKKLNRD